MDFLTDVATTIFTSKRRLNTEQLQELYRRRALIILVRRHVALAKLRHAPPDGRGILRMCGPNSR